MWLAFVKLVGGARATAFLLAAVALGAAVGVQTWRLDHAHGKIEQAKAEIFAANQVAAETKRRSEAEIKELRAEYEQEKADGQVQLDRALADLHAERRLRQRFRCPAGEAGSAGAAAGGDAAPEGGLLDSDVEFLLRLGAEADDVVRQLTLCQDYVRTITR